MMVLEKRKNLKTMMVLGLTKKEVGKIFLYQGWIISLSGCVAGLAIGSILLILQSNFSLFMITPSLALQMISLPSWPAVANMFPSGWITIASTPPSCTLLFFQSGTPDLLPNPKM